ncbi:glycosyltransferase family 39 protein [Kordia algicida OT-1]|uniref:Putative phosphatidylinositol-4-phosphate 5-kinase n=1 Tax=Kordia algicida OT-1 TaxID=391587 RepID=A9DUR9_9FLAO|nr:glycosyltransferase family 39 protein [Kordia algicida]EDP96325.1 putative phosphatidylinositol-4-phosphate 5-kinase [Kordia algicida OT-1]
MLKTILSNRIFISISYISILLLAFLKIYSSIFDEKISLVGDNASYYILGTAIANGEGYTNIHHKEKEAHYHYPPGYPLLIAGVSKVFSNDIISIKNFNGILLFGSILLLFFLVKCLTENNNIAFAVSFITLLNYHILEYSTIMMSEIPFLFFSLVGILLTLKIDFSKPVFKNGRFVLLVICVTFSFYIRSVALALLISIAFFLLLKKHWKYLYSFIGGFALLYFPWMLRNWNAVGNTYVSQLSLKNPYQPELGTVSFSEIIDRIILNLERYITKEIPSGLVQVGDIIYDDVAVPIIIWFLGFLLLGGIAFGIYKLPKFRILIASYILAFFGLLLLWPSVWYGTRFLVPIIPLLLFLLIFGILQLLMLLRKKVASRRIRYFVPVTMVLILSIWTFAYGKQSIPKLKEKAAGVYANNYKNYFEIAKLINKKASENTVTSVRKEGLFYLVSEKYVTGFQKTLDREAQIEYLKSKHVNYVVVDQLGFSATSKYLVPVIDRYPNKFKTILELKNPNTYLMEFLPDLGYTGAWENDKRNGFGTYLWEDGQKYEGFWKDDVRHGKGTVFFKNGENLSGVWTNGKLNGEVIKKDKNGIVIEKSNYQNNVKVEVIEEVN